MTIPNCSSISDYMQEINNMTGRLRVRGYPDWVLNRALTRVKFKDRHTLLCDKSQNNESHTSTSRIHTPIVFSTAFSSEFRDICNLVKKHIPMLMYDPALDNVFKAGFRCVAKKAPTLAQDLSPSSFTSHEGKNMIGGTWLGYKGFVGCGHRICICCSFVKKTNKILSLASGEMFNIQHYINCNSNNVICVINCEECKMQYVGHTTQNLKNRIRKHISDVPHASIRNISAASQHFHSVHNNSTSSLSVIGIPIV